MRDRRRTLTGVRPGDSFIALVAGVCAGILIAAILLLAVAEKL